MLKMWCIYTREFTSSYIFIRTQIYPRKTEGEETYRKIDEPSKLYSNQNNKLRKKKS